MSKLLLIKISAPLAAAAADPPPFIDSGARTKNGGKCEGIWQTKFFKF